MDQNVDEIAQSYEIIDRNELDTTNTDDASNNNQIVIEEETETPPTTAQITPRENDDNNNQNGNKKYTRDELIKLKTPGIPPPVLKDTVKGFIYKEATLIMDRILDRSKPLTRGDAVDKMMPSYANMPNNRNSYQKQRSNDGRRSAQGNRSQNSSLIKVSLQSNEEVKLNEASNAWKPQMMNSTQDLPEDEKKTAELMKQFRSILNKITPENFSTLIQQLKVLNIDSVDILDSCISLVFEKAIMEPNYGASYAQLCKEVSDVFVVPLDENNSQQKAVFKKRLITQCQKEFEKHRDNELVKNNAERLKEIEDEEDITKQEELKANFELEGFKIRRRAVGTVHFIGELYKIEMLTSRIMQSCIQHLLDPGMCSEETLECLCKLLTTIGKRLEKLDAKKVDLSEYFKTLETIANKNSTVGISARIRFMIQDLVELRLNNWTPRKLQRENKPLTMVEIKKQVEMEQFINQMDNKEAAQREGDRGQNNRSGFYQGGGSGNKRGNVVSEDGWSTQLSKSRPLKLDMNKLQCISTSEEIVLGGVPSFQNFGNRFSDLKEEEPVSDQSNRPYNGRFSGGGQGMNQSQNRNNFGNNRGNRNNTNNSNNSNNRSSASRSLQPPLQSNQKQQPFSPSRKISYQPQNMTPFHRPGDVPIRSNMQRKISAPARPANHPLEAYKNLQEKNLTANPEQVKEAMAKMQKAYQNEEIVMADIFEKLRFFRISKQALVLVFNWVFDQHDKQRFQMTEIICEGIVRGAFMLRDFLDALQETIENAPELVCDLPHIYTYIGQLLALPLLRRIIHVTDFLRITKSEIEANNGAKILKNVFNVFEQKFGKEGLRQLFNDAILDKFDFKEFLDSDTQLIDFFKENVSLCCVNKFLYYKWYIFIIVVAIWIPNGTAGSIVGTRWNH